MKSVFSVLAITLLAGVVQAQTILLEPGERVNLGGATVACSSGGYGSGGGNYTPAGPECELAGAGMFNGYSYSYIVTIDGRPLAGANTLSSAIENIQQFRSQKLCSTRPSKECKLQGAGTFAGYSYSYVVGVGKTSVAGSNTLSSALEIVKTLFEARVCRPRPDSRCQLMGAGTFAGYSYSYTVGVDGVVVAGSNTQSSALETINSLRTAGLCF